MSRLVINIEHTNDGKLAFGVQSDNADQQVALLQHQLAGFQEQREDFAALKAGHEELQAQLVAVEAERDALAAQLARAKRRR